MEREDEDATQERRLFRRAPSSLLGSIEAAAAARARRALLSEAKKRERAFTNRGCQIQLLNGRSQEFASIYVQFSRRC
ncbi:hypothetical protein HN51_054990 [Arachis hypogaea]